MSSPSDLIQTVYNTYTVTKDLLNNNRFLTTKALLFMWRGIPTTLHMGSVLIRLWQKGNQDGWCRPRGLHAKPWWLGNTKWSQPLHSLAHEAEQGELRWENKESTWLSHMLPHSECDPYDKRVCVCVCISLSILPTSLPKMSKQEVNSLLNTM